MAACPRCPHDHVGCTFGAGSLGCVKVDCANPHHAKQWVNVTAVDVIARRDVPVSERAAESDRSAVLASPSTF